MASDINSVTLVGRLTRDAELSYTQGGMPVVALSVAVNRARKENDQWIEEVSYFDISYFSKAAENLKQYLTKGKQIAVQGALKQDRWEKDGQKFNKVRIMANSVELLGGRSEGMGGGAPQGSSASYQTRQSYTPRPSAPMQNDMPPDSFGGDGQGFPEDIPF